MTIIHSGIQEASCMHIAHKLHVRTSSVGFSLTALFPVFLCLLLSLSLMRTLFTSLLLTKLSLCLLVFLHFRFLESLLRQASNALIVHCPTLHCFVNQTSDNEPRFRAEEFSDISGWPQRLITAILSVE